MSAWVTLKRRLLFSAKPWFEVFVETVRLPDGRIIEDYYQIEQRDYVEIVALNGRGQILGLWRYKHGPRCVNLGLPAGYVEEGEAPMDSARRELREECGLQSNEWTALGSFAVDGNRGSSRAHVFVAKNCEPAVSPGSDDLEDARSEWLLPQQWRQHLASGAVATLGVAVAILLGIDNPSQNPRQP